MDVSDATPIQGILLVPIVRLIAASREVGISREVVGSMSRAVGAVW